jgi:hypothetical protein
MKGTDLDYAGHFTTTRILNLLIDVICIGFNDSRISKRSI